MTKLHYECTDALGNKSNVTTLAEAKALTQNGGTYKIVYNREMSSSEAHCRPNARRPGELR